MANKKTGNKGIKLIKKSNNLIEARYKFDIWETRIFTSILTQIDRSDEDFHIYRVYMRDIIKEFNINNGNAYDLLREAANSLMNKKFFLDYEGDGAERKKVYHIIRNVDYMTKVKDESKRQLNEFIDVSIDPDMKPLLLQLKEQFTTYDVRNIIRFKSSYTVRIYEHLKQYESIGKRKMEVEYLKSAFDINDEYPLFANFYQKVIEPAYRDINEYTDLNITNIEKIKDGKKVVALIFYFHKKQEHDFKKSKKALKALELPLEIPLNDSPKNENLADDLFVQYQSRVVGELNVAPSVFMLALSGKKDEDVERALRVTENARKKGDISNIAGFFVEALRQGFTNEKEEKQTKTKQNATQKAILKANEAKEQLEKNQRINDKIRELTATDPNVTLNAIQEVTMSKAGKFRLKTLDLKSPTIDDFRNDSILRNFIKDAIVQKYEID